MALVAVVGQVVLGVSVAAQTGSRQVRPVEPVENLDLDRYMGRWYEVGRYPNRFQRKCIGDVVVFYARRSDGRLDVTNTCTTPDGPTEAVGVAQRADPARPASVLEVRFAPAWLSFLPVWGDYWVLDLAPDYSTAVVGTPSRESLWILSRTPHVDQPTWSRLLEAARRQGYDLNRVQRTAQQ